MWPGWRRNCAVRGAKKTRDQPASAGAETMSPSSQFPTVDPDDRRPCPRLLSNQSTRTGLFDGNATIGAKKELERSGEAAFTRGSFHQRHGESFPSSARRTPAPSRGRSLTFLSLFSPPLPKKKSTHRSSPSSSCLRSCSRPPSRPRPPTSTRRASAAPSSPTR